MDVVCRTFVSPGPTLPSDLRNLILSTLVAKRMLSDDKLELLIDSTTQSLDLSTSESLTDATMITISKKCPKLTSLSLGWCRNITIEGLKVVLESCHELDSLSFSYWTHMNDNVANLLAGYRNISQLVRLNVSGCQNITDNTMVKLLPKLQSLKFLDISHCKALTGNTLKVVWHIHHEGYRRNHVVIIPSIILQNLRKLHIATKCMATATVVMPLQQTLMPHQQSIATTP